MLTRACHGDKPELLKILLDKGFDPKRLEDKGSWLIQSLLWWMTYGVQSMGPLQKRKRY
jgi:hypothetical protein